MLEILSGSRAPKSCPEVEGFRSTDVHMFEFTKNADLIPRFPRTRTKPTVPSNHWRADILTAMQACVTQSILIHPARDLPVSDLGGYSVAHSTSKQSV